MASLPHRSPLLLVGVGLLVAGCNVILGYDEGEPAAGGQGTAGSSAQGGASGGTGGGTTGTGTATATGTTTGTGGQGGYGPGLDSVGLVARYFIDEAASGTPGDLADAAANPLPLSANASGGIHFVEVDGHRALSWDAAGVDDRALVAIDGTKIHQRLHGTTELTIEVVVDVRDAVIAAMGGSRLVHVAASAQGGRLALYTPDATLVGLRFNEDEVARWTVDLANGGRVVLHCVVDTEATDAPDRTLLYLDGTLLGTTTLGVPPGQGEPLDLLVGGSFVLGNGTDGGLSFAGELYYAALYDRAMDAGTVEHNATRLLESDDF